LAVTTVSLPVLAQPRAGTTETAAAAPSQTDEQRKAQEHFQRAKELYQAGKYSEAISELEIARGLDPKAKDLVMNLGIVHEKLGRYDDAIANLKTFLEMEGVTPTERTKVEGMIKRLEGAKQSAPTAAPPPSASATITTAPPPPATTPSAEPPRRGRIDALTIAAGSVAVVGLGLGAGLGAYALSSRPGDGFVTGRDGTYKTLQRKTDDAHTTAIVADVSLGVGVVAALATAWFYFGRTKDPTPAVAPASGNVSLTPVATRAGGALVLGGAF
jgi:tetratricopeptide (TPR) repeat protein